MSGTIEDAIALAARAHEGQTRKGSTEPFILHPIRVMLKVSGLHARIVAVLHDAIKDTELTLEDLHNAYFPGRVIEGIDALTHRKGEFYFDYIRRAAQNLLAREVKIADIKDNMDDETRPNHKSLEGSYREALRILERHRG